MMVYKILTLEKDYTEYDPFEILQLDPVLTVMHHYELTDDPPSRSIYRELQQMRLRNNIASSVKYTILTRRVETKTCS